MILVVGDANLLASGFVRRKPDTEGCMTRHDGSVVDVDRHRERDRFGGWHSVERLMLTASGLYYGRDWENDALLMYTETWLLPEPGWAVHRIAFRPEATVTPDWYIETDMVDVDGTVWHQRDGYLDLYVFEGSRYELLDADELAEGLAAGHITADEVVVTLSSLDRLCGALHRLGFSGRALLEEFAPDLPR